MCIRDRLAPQIFLSGVIQPVQNLPNLLQNISKVLPLTYGVEGLRLIMIDGSNLSGVSSQIFALVIFASIFVILATLTIKR